MIAGAFHRLAYGRHFHPVRVDPHHSLLGGQEHIDLRHAVQRSDGFLHVQSTFGAIHPLDGDFEYLYGAHN